MTGTSAPSATFTAEDAPLPRRRRAARSRSPQPPAQLPSRVDLDPRSPATVTATRIGASRSSSTSPTPPRTGPAGGKGDRSRRAHGAHGGVRRDDAASGRLVRGRHQLAASPSAEFGRACSRRFAQQGRPGGSPACGRSRAGCATTSAVRRTGGMDQPLLPDRRRARRHRPGRHAADVRVVGAAVQREDRLPAAIERVTSVMSGRWEPPVNGSLRIERSSPGSRVAARSPPRPTPASRRGAPGCARPARPSGRARRRARPEQSRRSLMFDENALRTSTVPISSRDPGEAALVTARRHRVHRRLAGSGGIGLARPARGGRGRSQPGSSTIARAGRPPSRGRAPEACSHRRPQHAQAVPGPQASTVPRHCKAGRGRAARVAHQPARDDLRLAVEPESVPPLVRGVESRRSSATVSSCDWPGVRARRRAAAVRRAGKVAAARRHLLERPADVSRAAGRPRRVRARSASRRRKRNEHTLDAELLGERAGVERASAAEGDERRSRAGRSRARR